MSPSLGRIPSPLHREKGGAGRGPVWLVCRRSPASGPAQRRHRGAAGRRCQRQRPPPQGEKLAFCWHRSPCPQFGALFTLALSEAVSGFKVTGAACVGRRQTGVRGQEGHVGLSGWNQPLPVVQGGSRVCEDPVGCQTAFLVRYLQPFLWSPRAEGQGLLHFLEGWVWALLGKVLIGCCRRGSTPPCS